jgi:uracil-DNA glycosylase
LAEIVGSTDPSGARLTEWAPQRWTVAPDWQPTVDLFLKGPAGQQLGHFIHQRLAAGAIIYPPQPLRALALTPLSRVKVVILGQDPYHGPGQAEGLAFSVAPGLRLPPSLRNIFKELAQEAAQTYAGAPAKPLPASGSLVNWADQGVLLLNACLTVERGLPASHANQGWEALTNALVQAVLGNGNPVIFLLWGAHAQKMAGQVQAAAGNHKVLTANHPSPLSALRPPQPFIGCGHFREANAWLKQSGETSVDW